MNGKEMREKLHSGERVYGTMIVAESPRWPSAAAGTGIDFAFIDTEHPAHDREKMSWMCQLYEAHGIVPVVRIPSPNPYEASIALDGGARGVIAPYVETVEQTRAHVGAVKYRPLKGAKLYDHLDGKAPLEPELKEHLLAQNGHNIAIVNIESIAALNALDDILDVDGLDAVLIGPNDLTTNLGIPNQYDHPRYVEAVDMVVTKARAKNIGVGNHIVYAGGMDQEIRWAKMGLNMVTHSMDIVAFRNGIRQEIDTIKAALSEAADGSALKDIHI